MRAVVGIGSNLGDRLAQLREAVHRLEAHGVAVARRAAVYETAPIGGPAQGPFLNSAILVDHAGTPQGLLDVLLAVEREMGRVRRERWGPRLVDLDVLCIEGLIVNEPGLVVPHPRLLERAFALRPLVDIWPDAVDPHTGNRYADALGQLGEQGVRRVAISW